jgi:hypothetical protein
MKHRSPSRRRALPAGAALVLVAGTPFVLSGSASATGTFEALAAAYGADYILTNQSIPAGFSPQFGGPTAQAQLTSLPSGTSFASFPYPGEVAAGVPGLVSGVATGVPQLPAYPFIVSAGLGQGPQQVNQPGIAMRANTENTNASAHAVFGTDGMGSVADSLISVEGGHVTATSVSRDSLLSLGDQGEIGSVRSIATVSSGADGKIDRTSSLAISGIRIPALQFTVPATSPGPAPIPNAPFPQVPLPFAGTTVVSPILGLYDGQFTIQLPGTGKQQFAVPADSVTQAFKSAGYDVDYAAPRQTPDGIVGATLQLHFKLPAPPDNPLYAGPSDVTLVLGRANASVTNESGTGVASAPGASSAVGPTNSAPGAAAPALRTATGSAGLNTGYANPAGFDNETGTTNSASSGGAGAQPVGNLTVGNTTAQSLNSTATGFEAAGVSLPKGPLDAVYLALAAAGLLGVFSIPTLRLRGGRNS